MSTSGCTNTKHAEYDCLTARMVNKKKFPREKWCDPCKKKFPYRGPHPSGWKNNEERNH